MNQPNPFSRPGKPAFAPKPYEAPEPVQEDTETRFMRSWFFDLLNAGLPIAAKHLLQEAIDDGRVRFPAGLSSQTAYGYFAHYIDEGTDDAQDIALCHENTHLLNTYRHLWQNQPSQIDADDAAFPLPFALELLDRMAAGEHPLFDQWALHLLKELLPEAPRTGGTPAECGRDWTPSISDPDLPFLVPDTTGAPPVVPLDWQVDYPHGVG